MPYGDGKLASGIEWLNSPSPP